MRYSYRLLALTGAAAFAAAQAPANTTICDYYTNALLGNTNATNQLTVLTLVVNTAVIGSYERPEIPGVTFPDVEVAGILSPNATYEGTPVNLAQYFDGSLLSTNRDGQAVSVNFLDGGGAEPLMQNMPANDDSSNQYRLLTGLYSYFGTLLGCSSVGSDGFPAYSGPNSQYRIHQFMALDSNEMSYFIQQVGTAAARFGVADSDVTAVGQSLNGLFNVRCAAESQPIPSQDAALQSICTASDCPTAPNATCSAYENNGDAFPEPAAASGASGNGTASPTTGSPSPSSSTPAEGGAAANVAGASAAGLFALAAFFL